MEENTTKCLDMNEELWEYRSELTTQPAVMAIFAFLYSIIILFGVTGNICVILAISKTRSLQTVPNLFIFSLSCSDIVVCCVSATITPISAFTKEWIFGATLCYVAPFIAGISLCFSTFTLTAISVDRFILIRFPTKKAFNRQRAIILIVIIWITSACLSSPIILKQRLGPFSSFCGVFCSEDWGPDQSGRKLYGAVMVGVQFVVPLTIICASYTSISARINQNLILKVKRNSYMWQMEMTDQQRAALKRRQRTNRMLIAMVVAFSVSWFWNILFNGLRDYDHLPEWMRSQEFFFGIATHCIAMTSTVWNPLLYAALNPQFRAAFVSLLPFKTPFYSRSFFSNSGTILERCRPLLLRNGSSPLVLKKTQTTKIDDRDRFVPM
ncbi:hypothetical protein AB6A40_009057 [Gnathostoma spinigerum]|uniref:G-protein coupled receptors family 1 profile domain-containing protein n=1 Tax=Gnathostoma spinigerum TaxID=75299 RepID=A0ABD6EZ39_9BILA